MNLSYHICLANFNSKKKNKTNSRNAGVKKYLIKYKIYLLDSVMQGRNGLFLNNHQKS